MSDCICPQPTMSIRLSHTNECDLNRLNAKLATALAERDAAIAALRAGPECYDNDNCGLGLKDGVEVCCLKRCEDYRKARAECLGEKNEQNKEA